jgi:hypothetical protein
LVAVRNLWEPTEVVAVVAVLERWEATAALILVVQVVTEFNLVSLEQQLIGLEVALVLQEKARPQLQAV